MTWHSPPTLHVIIPSRGLESLLRKCLDHLAEAVQTENPFGHRFVTLIDNASDPPYPHPFPAPPGLPLRIQRRPVHTSFAACCNDAVRSASADILLFLNNDVLLHPRALCHMMALMDRHPHTALVGTRLIFPDGTLQHAGVVFGADDFGPRHFARRVPSRLVSRMPTRHQAVTAAALLARAPVFDALGGFDEGYPFGLEDVDFCLRAGQAGGIILCDQSVDSIHFESQTPGRIELNIPSHRRFMERWRGRFTVDAPP